MKLERIQLVQPLGSKEQIMNHEKKLDCTLGSTTAFKVKHYLVENEDYAVAESKAGDIGITWNKSKDRPQGFPSTFKHQQWFILPKPVAKMVLAGAELLLEQQ